MTLQNLWNLLTQAPPSPPEDLLAARRELKQHTIAARRATREYTAAIEDQHNALARFGSIARLIRNGKH